jgi:hypothetical protein
VSFARRLWYFTGPVKQIPHPVQVLHLTPGELPVRLPASVFRVERLARVSLWTDACRIVNGR